MSKKGFAYIGTAIVSVLLVMALVLSGCQKCPECVTLQSVSHMSGPLDLTAAATEAAPGLYFAGDSDTGLYSAAANQLGLSTGGTERLNLSSSGIGFTGGLAATLGAAEKVLVDGETTAHTDTDGALDVDAATITANVSAVNVAMTQSDGATAGEDVFGQIITLTGNDANGDMFGLKIEGAATTNAAAGTYEALASLVCSENTAGACPDALLVTAGATDTSVTDGVDVSDSEIVNAINIGVNPILGSNADTLSLGVTNHHLILIGDEDADLTFMGQDNATPADTIFDTFGAGTVVVGSADVTVVTIQTDDTGDGSDLVLPAQGVNAGEILNDTITFAQIADTTAVDADTNITLADGIELSLTASHTTGDTEALLLDVNQATDATATDDFYALKIDATSESAEAGDTFRGIGVVWENGAANTIMDAAIAIDNEETTAGTMTDAVIVTSSGVALGVTDAFDASDSNIVNALNIGDNLISGGDDSVSIGATDDTLILTSNDATAIFMGADAAGAADTIYDTTGAGTVTVGSADALAVVLTSDSDVQIQGGASGNVDLSFHDYADSADDDMAHVLLRANCTTATTGAEDCDFTVGVAEGGNAADTRFMIDADGGVDLGSAANPDVTLTAGTAVAIFNEPATAGTGGDIWDITATFAAMDGSDTSLGLDINLTGADATGTTNLLYGIDLDLTTADAQVTEKAIDLNDSDWDYAIDAGAVPIVSTAATFMDDFFGGTVQTWWTEVSGTDPQAAGAIQANAQYGEFQITSGDDGANCAADCQGLVLGTHWSADQGSLIFETRLHIDTSVGNDIVFAGFSDNAALEMPVTMVTDTITYVAHDHCGFIYDTTSTTDVWFASCFANGVMGTGSGATAIIPAFGVSQVLRVEIDAGGADARFYINGALVKTITAGAITITDLLTPMIMVDTNAAESNVVDVDYVFVSAQRQ